MSRAGRVRLAVLGVAVAGLAGVMTGVPHDYHLMAQRLSRLQLPVLGGNDAGTSPVGPHDLDGEQLANAAAIVRIGQQRQLPPRAWQVALQAGLTESRLRNLGYGDRDSVGIFQMRPSAGWGSRVQLRDVTYQVNAFYGGQRVPPDNPGLLDVPDWQRMRPGDAAQAVERSAFPDRYHTWEPLAAALVNQLGGVRGGGW